jgi:predicted amidohydrolase
MRQPLEIAVAQPECEPYEVAVNAVRHAAAVCLAGARVVVFPELSLTGYQLDAAAITIDDPRLAPVVEACAEAGTVALVGAPVQEEAGAYIAMLAIDAAGASVAYRKVCVDVTEAPRFAPGRSPALVEVDGWRLGLAVCRDIGDRQHASDTAALGIDAYLAGTLTAAADLARQDERARRIAADHHVWVAMASFAGSTGGFADAAGRSGVWAPDGRLVAQASPQVGAVVRATLT